jgi:hypothetical protein
VLCLKELEGGVRSDVSALTHEQGQVNGPLLNELHRVQFLVEARQIKLLSELQAIYPIHPLDSSATSSHGGGSGVGNRDSVSAAGWCIRNLELPRDLTALEDEHVSSALGYVVHLVALLSKYLQVTASLRGLLRSFTSFLHLPIYTSNVSLSSILFFPA